MMARKTLLKPQTTTRENAVRIFKTEKGFRIMCPFCNPAHPLEAGRVAPCGTVLKMTAVQEVVSGRSARLSGLVCLKCHKTGGGDLIHWQNGYVHKDDCNPEQALLVVPPRFSWWAGIRYRVSDWFKNRKVMAFVRGNAQRVKEINPEGVETGRILGYVFVEGKP